MSDNTKNNTAQIKNNFHHQMNQIMSTREAIAPTMGSTTETTEIITNG